MKFNILTIFPDIFDSYFSESIIKRAQEKKLVQFNIHNIRDQANDKHKTVDDAPYGGGPGMLMKIEPLYKTLKKIRRKKKSKVVLLSASGKKWNQAKARKYSGLDQIVLICGRYEGVDARIKHFVDEEISIGDYVLTGGELGAMVIVDSVTRLLPGVLGKQESAEIESHSQPGYLEYPQYTRPEVFKVGKKEYKVPKVLLSGDHAKIENWRAHHSKKIEENTKKN